MKIKLWTCFLILQITKVSKASANKAVKEKTGKKKFDAAAASVLRKTLERKAQLKTSFKKSKPTSQKKTPALAKGNRRRRIPQKGPDSDTSEASDLDSDYSPTPTMEDSSNASTGVDSEKTTEMNPSEENWNDMINDSVSGNITMQGYKFLIFYHERDCCPWLINDFIILKYYYIAYYIKFK